MQKLGLIVLVLVCTLGMRAESQTLESDIKSKTQELFDAVAVGNKAPWQKYVADDVLFFDEQGHNMDKTALVASVEPLPAGYSGTIKTATDKFNLIGTTLVHSYDTNETETIHGQELHARYHETDTWMNRKGEWQIVAGQVLRYYEDPAPGSVDSKKFADYIGTYQLATDKTVVSTDGGKLYLQRGDKPKTELIPEACDIFFRKGVEGRMVFHYANGKVDAMFNRRNNEDVVWKKVE
jgi:hypothetical protein